MISHFLKLTWNKKKKHLVLVIELMVAYLAVSFLMLFLTGITSKYTKTAKFDTENVISLETYNTNDTIRQNLGAIKEVQYISSSDFTPYSNRAGMRGEDTLFYGDKNIVIAKVHTDEYLQTAIKLSMQSGRWFTASDKNDIKSPLIITTGLKNQLFPGSDAEGRIVKMDSSEYKIVGVVNNLGDPADNSKQERVFILRPGANFLVRLNKPMDDQIYKKMKNAMTGFQNEFRENIFPIKEYEDSFRANIFGLTIFFGGLSIYLIINVVLGLFSMLYQNINKRRPEIGLRRASGATAGQIYSQIVLEVVLLTSIALIPGIIIAYQAVLFEVFGIDSNYYTAMSSGACIIYVLGILCALYPAKLASKIQPAMALHEE